MKLPIDVKDAVDAETSTFLLDDLPFDPTLQFTSMGFQRKEKALKPKTAKLHDGKNNIKRHIDKFGGR